MSAPIIDVRMPRANGCSEACQDCQSGQVFVQSVLVQPGDHVHRDDCLIVLETNKVALDLPSPVSGVILAVLVSPHDPLYENDLIVRIQPDP